MHVRGIKLGISENKIADVTFFSEDLTKSICKLENVNCTSSYFYCFNKYLQSTFSWFLLLILFLATLSGCSSEKKDPQIYNPIIINPDGIIGSGILDALQNELHTPGFRYVIQAVDSIPNIFIGAEADNMWDSIMSQYKDSDEIKDRSVYLFVSKRPALIQARVGEDLLIKAYFGGIISGKTYVDIQKIARENLEFSLDSMIRYLSKHIPPLIHKSFFEKIVYNDISQELAYEIQDFEAPTDSFYGNYILSNLVRINIFSGNWFRGWWASFILSAFIAYLIGKIFNLPFKIFLWPLVRKRISSNTSEIQIFLLLALVSIVIIVINIVSAIPPIQAALLISGARLEDQIALNASGFYMGTYFAWPSYFSEETTIWIALLVVVVRLSKAFSDNLDMLNYANLESSEQVRIFELQSERNPLYGLAVQMLAHGRDGDFDENSFAESPYSHVMGKVVLREFFAAIRWGLFCWLLCIQGFTLIALCFLIFSVFSKVIPFLYKRFSRPKAKKHESSEWISLVVAFSILVGIGLLYYVFRINDSSTELKNEVIVESQQIIPEESSTTHVKKHKKHSNTKVNPIPKNTPLPNTVSYSLHRNEWTEVIFTKDGDYTISVPHGEFYYKYETDNKIYSGIDSYIQRVHKGDKVYFGTPNKEDRLSIIQANHASEDQVAEIPEPASGAPQKETAYRTSETPLEEDSVSVSTYTQLTGTIGQAQVSCTLIINPDKSVECKCVPGTNYDSAFYFEGKVAKNGSIRLAHMVNGAAADYVTFKMKNGCYKGKSIGVNGFYLVDLCPN